MHGRRAGFRDPALRDEAPYSTLKTALKGCGRCTHVGAANGDRGGRGCATVRGGPQRQVDRRRRAGGAHPPGNSSVNANKTALAARQPRPLRPTLAWHHFCAGAAAVSVPLCAARSAGRGGGGRVALQLNAPWGCGPLQQPAGGQDKAGWVGCFCTTPPCAAAAFTLCCHPAHTARRPSPDTCPGVRLHHRRARQVFAAA